MVYGIFRKNAKPTKRGSMATPFESGFKTKKKAKKYYLKMKKEGIKGYKIVNLN